MTRITVQNTYEDGWTSVREYEIPDIPTDVSNEDLRDLLFEYTGDGHGRGNDLGLVSVFTFPDGERERFEVSLGLMTLPDRIVLALRSSHELLAQGSAQIRRMYQEAEDTGDYSDADETAADIREQLHDDFTALMDVFAEVYPDVFQ